jgi:hypothetical protein
LPLTAAPVVNQGKGRQMTFNQRKELCKIWPI